ncbi:MAG: MMPL family transporter, partial [Candidatus Gracilibacteria bacterium]|nr:MMPL family transporter [Candidatus Gracilibacteria bacterium]
TITQEEAQEKADELLKRVREEDVYTVERIWFNTIPYPWEETELDGRYFKRADVAYDQQTFRPYVQVQFDDTGAELFEKITGDNVGKMIGIFVGGEFISSPVVNEKIAGGIAQITLGQTNVQVALQEANNLSQSLNAGSVPAPLKKPNELNIGATLGQESLQKSLMAGALGLLLVALFMILYYRFLGILAFLSLVVYGLFLTFVIQSEVMPLIAIAMTFVLWIAFSLRLFTAKIDGIAKALFLAFSVMGVLFVFQVLVNPIVLTLAGVAGLILSIGMAVDANILIFERMKEEFAEGKSFHTAVADGFERAWSSILDSNVSSLITCAILFSFGSSIIKGFAINLAAGIVISMFTAIAVTRTFIFVFEGTRL